jgi:hypothetical protein
MSATDTPGTAGAAAGWAASAESTPSAGWAARRCGWQRAGSTYRAKNAGGAAPAVVATVPSARTAATSSPAGPNRAAKPSSRFGPAGSPPAGRLRLLVVSYNMDVTPLWSTPEPPNPRTPNPRPTFPAASLLPAPSCRPEADLRSGG